MSIKINLGNLIDCEVRKQQIPITDFADKICCSRGNVYDILKRPDFNIQQLQLISKVLNKNFFKILADEMDQIINNQTDLIVESQTESEVDILNRKAVSKFLDVVPNIMKRMKKYSTIVFAQSVEGIDGPLPDFGMPDYGFSFTVGDTWRERIGTKIHHIEDVTHPDGYMFEKITTITNNYKFVNIPITYHSEKEWEKIFNFVFNTIKGTDFIISYE